MRTVTHIVRAALAGALATALLAGCSGTPRQEVGMVGGPAREPRLVTPAATAETVALYGNLGNLAGTGILFGHQNTTAYGVEWTGDAGRSDVKDVAGSFPAVFGWDLGHLELGEAKNLDGIQFEFIRYQIIGSYRRGSVSTLSWHMRDLVTGGSSWDAAPTVRDLIPGGASHDALRAALDRFVEFNETLTIRGADGSATQIPVIFRPWHEHNGDWFWWGTRHTSEDEFIALWRFTVEFLRDERGVSNLIYAFSPDRSRMDLRRFPDSYLYGYPGDEYVDILGLDNYWDLGHSANRDSLETRKANFAASLEAVVALATERGKLAAMTEGGQEGIREEQFWTDQVLAGLLANETTRRLSYLLVWRNANRARENWDHFFASYRGHTSEADFRAFANHPITLFEDDLPPLYE